jgi:hypothetical protein
MRCVDSPAGSCQETPDAHTFRTAPWGEGSDTGISVAKKTMLGDIIISVAWSLVRASYDRIRISVSVATSAGMGLPADLSTGLAADLSTASMICKASEADKSTAAQSWALKGISR